MRIKYLIFLFGATFLLFNNVSMLAQSAETRVEPVDNTESSLVVLWTTSEKDVFTKMLYIYTITAKKQAWFDDVTLIVWGPSAKLLAEDKELQSSVKKLAKAGVKLEACSWCTNQYGVTDDLKNLGIDVRGMGKSLTDYIKDDNKEVLIF